MTQQNAADEVVTYDDLIAVEESAIIASLKADGVKAADDYDPLTDSTPTYKAKAAATVTPSRAATTKALREAEARFAETELVGQIPVKPAELTADRLDTLRLTLVLEQRRYSSRTLRRQFRRAGLSALTIARRELGLSKDAGYNDTLAAIAERMA